MRCCLLWCEFWYCFALICRSTSICRSTTHSPLETKLDCLVSIDFSFTFVMSNKRNISQVEGDVSTATPATKKSAVDSKTNDAPQNTAATSTAATNSNAATSTTPTTASALDSVQGHMQSAVQLELKLCADVLAALFKHKDAFLFEKPVDVEGLGLKDYHDIIKNPMDFSIIRKRLESNYYPSASAFRDDVMLTFNNALTYNPKGTQVHKMTLRILAFFDKRWASLTNKVGM